MRLSTFFGASLLSLALPLLTVADHGPRARRHESIALRARGDVQAHKRGETFNGRFTFYDVGLGACGKYNQPGDFIVALNSAQYGGGYPGPHCFQTITITYGGKTAQATIMDECPGCPYGGLDFSRGLFDHFASEDLGVLNGQWWFGGGGGGGSGNDDPAPSPEKKTTKKPDPTPTPTPTPKSTKKPDPTPTPTPTPTPSPSHTPSSSKEEESSSKESSSSKSSSSSSKSASASSSASSSAASATPSTGNTLDNLGQAVIGLGSVVVAGSPN